MVLMSGSHLTWCSINKIASLCAARRIQLVLFNAPVTAGYRSLIPKEAVKDFNKMQVDLQAEYQNLSFLDLSALDLPIKSFYDCDHVNLDGARVVTGIIGGQIL